MEWPGDRPATGVLRQNRSLLYWDGTVMSVVPEFTSNSCPVSAFCGSPPSAGGLKRGSIQVPVQVGGSCGSILLLARVSLEQTSVRNGVFVPSMLFSHRVVQNISFPLKNARFTPPASAV